MDTKGLNNPIHRKQIPKLAFLGIQILGDGALVGQIIISLFVQPISMIYSLWAKTLKAQDVEVFNKWLNFSRKHLFHPLAKTLVYQDICFIEFWAW